MSKHIFLRPISILLLILILLTALCLIWFFIKERNPYRLQQVQLAKELNVRIEDYPLPRYFPQFYFDEVLKPGMEIEDVHNLVKGYDLVYACDHYSEIYYYFSKFDDKALRFEIFYDDHIKFESIQGEDENSRTIRVEDCVRNSLVK